MISLETSGPAQRTRTMPSHSGSITADHPLAHARAVLVAVPVVGLAAARGELAAAVLVRLRGDRHRPEAATRCRPTRLPPRTRCERPPAHDPPPRRSGIHGGAAAPLSLPYRCKR
jgi:hypothetical protein